MLYRGMKVYDKGDKYKIIENGKVLTGVIIEVLHNCYRVEWNDGKITCEEMIDLKREWINKGE